MEKHDWYSVVELADYLRVNRETIRRLISAGHLTGTKVGRQFRVPQAAVDRYLSRDISKVA